MIHGAGGDMLTFQPTGSYLAGRYNVWGVQAAGVDGESPLHDSQEQMASSYLAEIRQVQPAGPYLLAGFSTGGVIAADLVKRIQAAGDVVEALILIDAFFPTMRPRSIPVSEHLANLIRFGPEYGLSRARKRLEIFDIWEGVIDDARGWSSVAGDLRIVKVPGDHMNLLEEPHARVFAERLADVLDGSDGQAHR